jgi:dimethylargininase
MSITYHQLSSYAFQRAIVRLPCENIIKALSHGDYGKPDYGKALEQHGHYVEALQQCGLEVIVMEADNSYPDSTFVEDTALLAPFCAIMTRPGAPSRRGEIAAIEEVVQGYFQKIEHIEAPGTVDAGDIIRIRDHYYIGLSNRTNREGARQMLAILERYELTGSTIPVRDLLHLKSGLAYLENDYLVTAGNFIDHPAFRELKQIKIVPSESYAANGLWLNGTVLVAAGYPNTSHAIQKAGFPVIELEMSEFRKVDGGLSCLSLRF